MPDERAPTARWRTATRSPINLLLAAATAVSVVAGCGPAPTDTTVGTTPELGVEHYTLDNGLEVILRRDHRVPIAAVNLQYHVGPANEGPGRTGFAHLFEHMMFQGSGHTGPDSYFATCRRPARRTSTPAPLRPHQLHRGRAGERARAGAVARERPDGLPARHAWTRRSWPTSRAWCATSAGRASSRRPTGCRTRRSTSSCSRRATPTTPTIIGSHADIQAAQLADVRDFFARYYVPNNASLAIVGNIDVAATKALIEKYFGSIPRGPELPEPQVATAAARPTSSG